MAVDVRMRGERGDRGGKEAEKKVNSEAAAIGTTCSGQNPALR
jgi:hypothetical protein